MKQFILFICLIAACFANNFAQNWQPLHKGDIYHFSENNANFISHSIWIDSVNVQNGDSLFYLNRIATKLQLPNAALGDSFYLLNQPQFLQKEMTKRANGEVVFSDMGNFVLLPFAHLNDTWIWDTLNNIQATLVSLDTLQRFGQIDSVKNILLSNGKSVRLSKNLGIIQFENYELKGIPSRNLGQSLMNYLDIFGMNEGDIYCFSGSGHQPGCGSYSITKQRIILNKIANTNSLTFIVDDWQKTFGSGCPFGGYHIANSSETYSDLPNEVYNQAYPNSYKIQFDTLMQGLSVTIFHQNLNQIIAEKFDYSQAIPDSVPIYNWSSNNAPEAYHFTQYTRGQGITGEADGYWEGGERYSLQSTGTQFCQGFTGIEIKQLLSPFYIYPNPAQDILIIKTIQQKLMFSIINYLGQEIVSPTDISQNTSYEISVKDWAGGIYFLEAQDEKGNIYTQIFRKE